MQENDALMKLLTSESQEDVVKRRVEKKAMVFGQDVTSDGPTETGDKIEVNPVSKLPLH
jgi:chorismate mutase